MQVSSTTALLGHFLVLLATTGEAQAPTGYRDHKWGARPGPDLVLKQSSQDGAMYVPKGKSPPLLGVPVAEEAYQFLNGRFYSGIAWIDGRPNFRAIEAALKKAFGTPSFSNPRLQLWKWQWPPKKIEVHLYYEPQWDRTTVTFLNVAI